VVTMILMGLIGLGGIVLIAIAGNFGMVIAGVMMAIAGIGGVVVQLISRRIGRSL
jgi:hypothetical protein